MKAIRRAALAVIALAVLMAAAPSKTVAAQTQPPVPADLAARIRSYLATQALADAFSGVVVLARHGDVVFSGAYGMASKEYAAPNTLDMRFNLGSINKLMTRIAVEQLVAQRKLSHDDTIGNSAALESGKLLDPAGTRSVLGEGIGVAGGAPGINADLEIDPASGYTLVVLSNYDPPSAEGVARQIREWIGLD